LVENRGITSKFDEGGKIDQACEQKVKGECKGCKETDC
jgi:hypothetical protein